MMRATCIPFLACAHFDFTSLLAHGQPGHPQEGQTKQTHILFVEHTNETVRTHERLKRRLGTHHGQKAVRQQSTNQRPCENGKDFKRMPERRRDTIEGGRQ